MPDPVSSNTAAEHRQAVSSLEGQPQQERQGILETTHRHPQPYEHTNSRSHNHHQSGHSVRLERAAEVCAS
jgi:hypothetical protein